MWEDQNDKDNNNESNKKKNNFWDMLPFIVKLKIIGVLVAIIFIVIVIAVLVASVNNVFLLFSEGVQETNDVESEYETFWQEFCHEGDASCSAEQINAQKELKNSQTKFYDKFKRLATSEKLDETAKYTVLATIFYGYDINDFTEGTGAYTLDETDAIDYDNASTSQSGVNVYKKETDSLKELIKQFKISTAVCKDTQNNPPSFEDFILRDDEDHMFSFSFWEKFKLNMGFSQDNEAYLKAKTQCEEDFLGEVKIEDKTTGEAALEAYYNYLRESTYLDDKASLKGDYKNYALNHNLNEDPYTWSDEDRIILREEIIANIKSIVDEHMKNSDGTTYVAIESNTYWWPIGSSSTVVENNTTYAKDNPESTNITSHFGYRNHPITGEYILHDGIDIAGTLNQTNIIAALDGVVTKVINECDSENSQGCGGGYGNYVEIQDNKGNINIYAHMYKDSITVQIGDNIRQGQVLGKVGSSGNSTGPHLHFTIKINGTSVNPEEYLSIDNPRPEISASAVDFHNSAFTREEFISKLNNYYSKDVCKKNSCLNFKSQIINSDGAATIYDEATSKNINPEIFIARVIVEGYSPGTSYNYFGYGCTNRGGVSACYKFGSFKDGVSAFFKNISKYTSLEEMCGKYAYIGAMWYTGVNWGLGGCAYKDYIYPNGAPERVENACSASNTCTKNHESTCVPTTDEDQEAYTKWQVKKMEQTINGVFG